MSAYKDYLFLLRPTELVARQIKFFKEKALEMIGPYPSFKSSAHISLIEYPRQKPFMMQPAIDTMAQKIEGFPSIQIQINGFNFFEHSEDKLTIFAAIQPTYQSDKWFDNLYKQSLLKKKSTPHITIARNIPVDSFYKLWPYFRYSNYKERFDITALTILERETLDPFKKWQIHREIPFRKEVQKNVVEEPLEDY
jgi:2'-5' RNA ligase